MQRAIHPVRSFSSASWNASESESEPILLVDSECDQATLDQIQEVEGASVERIGIDYESSPMHLHCPWILCGWWYACQDKLAKYHEAKNAPPWPKFHPVPTRPAFSAREGEWQPAPESYGTFHSSKE